MSSVMPSRRPADEVFLAVVMMLVGLGLVMVYSASITARPTDVEEVYLSRQLLFLVIAAGVGACTSLMPARFWMRSAPAIHLGVLILLLLVLVPGLGARVNGAQRWIRLASLSLQPSELAKLSIILLTSTIVSRQAARGLPWRKIVAGTVSVTLVPVLLVLVQPDLGTAVFLGLSAGIVLWMGGCPRRYFVGLGGLAIPGLGGLILLKPYQWARIQGFLSTWTDSSQAPYQVQQSLTSLGVGGVQGVGLGSGLQKLSFLPEANTDFVFAVIGEELGLIGTLGVISLWILLVLCGFRKLQRLPAGCFERIAASSLLTLLALQAVINMAVVTALLPPKGISHPLVSYGGSSLLTSLTGIGILISLCRSARSPFSADS